MKTRIVPAFLLALCAASPSHGSQTDIPGPPGSVNFGHRVYALPNGNVVVTDPAFDSNRGAVHLYSRAGQRISTLRGGTTSDNVGMQGVIVLPSGNFLVPSPTWSNGPARDAGAVTWVNGNTGLEATVSPQNSLVGTHASDYVGGFLIAVLKNGNYLVQSPSWSREKAGAVLQSAGALTWGRGTAGVAGAVSETNSLVGRSAGDTVGAGVIELANGHAVMSSPQWRGDGNASTTGASVWIDTTHATVGEVNASNALLGNRAGDAVGAGVFPLNDGSYYVWSPYWYDGTAAVGALTWCPGSGACLGNVGIGNSVVGATAYDFNSVKGLALRNGKLLTLIPNWTLTSPQAPSAGAVTVLPADGSVTGRLNPLSVLHGGTANDRVGTSAVLLDDGNAVVVSPDVDNSVADAGAASWIDANAPATGTVSVINSLFGSDSREFKVIPLSRGRYVVACPYCDVNGVTDSGAVQWVDRGGAIGSISGSSALHGSNTGDQVGSWVTALSNGNYVVNSSSWDNSVLFPNLGASTWVNGTNGVPRNAAAQGVAVSSVNSLTGLQTGDQVGWGGAVALSNGNYVVASRYWANGSALKAGAVTWANGVAGVSGYVDASNSLVGTSLNDNVGDYVVPLPNGNFVMAAPYWDERFPSGAVVENSGAVTWIDGKRGLAGTIDVGNSFLSNGNAKAYVGAASVLPSGDYVIHSAYADNCTQGSGCVADAGAWSFGFATHALHGRIEPANSLLGTMAGEGSQQPQAYNATTDQLVIGRPLTNVVSLYDRSLFKDGFD